MRPGPLREGAARPEAHLPAWAIERLAFEPETAPPGAEEHLGSCDECRRAAERLRLERATFLDARPRAPFLAQVSLRAEASGPPRGRGRWILGAAMATAAAVVAVLGVRLGARDEVRFKGDPGAALVLFVGRDGAAARPLEPAEALRPGDVLRFGVVSSRAAHVFVASVDEEGRFSRYYPAAGGLSAPLEGRDSLQVLPGSVVLDDTTGREWIVLVVAAAPIAEGRVEEALRRAHRDRSGGELGRVDLEGTAVVVPVRKERR